MIRTREEGRRLVATLGQHNAIFLVGHGIVTVGADVREAVAWSVLLERASRAEVLARSVAQPDSASVADSTDPSGERRTAMAAQVGSLWEYLVRRLPADDPVS